MAFSCLEGNKEKFFILQFISPLHQNATMQSSRRLYQPYSTGKFKYSNCCLLNNIKAVTSLCLQFHSYVTALTCVRTHAKFTHVPKLRAIRLYFSDIAYYCISRMSFLIDSTATVYCSSLMASAPSDVEGFFQDHTKTCITWASLKGDQHFNLATVLLTVPYDLFTSASHTVNCVT